MSAPPLRCSQAQCENEAIAMFIWPGVGHEQPICSACMPQLVATAGGLELHLPIRLIIPQEPVTEAERLAVLAFMGSTDPRKGLAELSEKGRALVDEVALSMRRRGTVSDPACSSVDTGRRQK